MLGPPSPLTLWVSPDVETCPWPQERKGLSGDTASLMTCRTLPATGLSRWSPSPRVPERRSTYWPLALRPVPPSSQRVHGPTSRCWRSADRACSPPPVWSSWAATSGLLDPACRLGDPKWTTTVQQDVAAAKIVWERCAPILVPLSVCLEARLRRVHLARLRGGGSLARLIANQSELYGTEEEMEKTGRQYPRLPDDLLNFHYDPLACAVAAGWDGAAVEQLELATRQGGGMLAFIEEPGASKTHVVTDVDGPRFEEEWLRAVTSVGQRN